MPKSSSSYEVLSYSVSRYSAHDTYIDSCIFYRFPDSQSVYDRTHHPHIVSCHTVESSGFELDTTEYITSSDHDHDLEVLLLHKVDYFFCQKSKEFRIDTISLISLESFSRELEEDTSRCMVFFHDRFLEESSIEEEHD
jgi:hypothetical protein